MSPLMLILALTVSAAAEPGPCSCETMAAAVVERMRSDYLGLPLIHARDERRRGQFEARVQRFLKAAADTDNEGCAWLISDWLDGFRDGHLFLVESDEPDTVFGSDGSARLAKAAGEPREDVHDPLVGSWYDGDGERYRIEATTEPGRLLARDAAGGIVARFERIADGYRVELVGESGRILHRSATIYRDGLLRMAPVMWGRVGGGNDPIGALDPEDPRRPIVREIEPGIVYVGMPSSQPQFRELLQQRIDAHRAALLEAELLIVDLRGNEGGSSGTIAPLAPFIYAEPHRPPIGSAGPSLVLASEFMARHLESWRQWWDEPPEWYVSMMAGVARKDGALVEQSPSSDTVWRPDSVHPRPSHVAVLLDAGSVSAAEAVALWARRQSRVQLVGEPTGGSIDLQTAVMVRVGCPDWGYLLGLPVVAAGPDIAERGLNATGIPVDLPMDLSRPDALERLKTHFGIPPR